MRMAQGYRDQFDTVFFHFDGTNHIFRNGDHTLISKLNALGFSGCSGCKENFCGFFRLRKAKTVSIFIIAFGYSHFCGIVHFIR